MKLAWLAIALLIVGCSIGPKLLVPKRILKPMSGPLLPGQARPMIPVQQGDPTSDDK